MPKYSTGSSGGSDGGDACELCGSETSSLQRANVAGADLLVCSECQPHDDTDKRLSESTDDETTSDATRRDDQSGKPQTQVYDTSRENSAHWEEHGTDYEEDRLPYLVSDYGEALETARQDEGLTLEELAADLEIDEDNILAVEQGRASRAGVGGSVVRALEQRLETTLVQE